MLLRFTKMHGLGNDFMVIDCLTQAVRLSPEKIRQWADRCRGVGFDQLLTVEAPTDPSADFRYRIYNADGSEAGQCGNGARCFARFVYEKKLSYKKMIRVQVEDRVMVLKLEDDGQVTANMGEPVLMPEAVPFNASVVSHNATYSMDIATDRAVDISVLSMGNPHAVLHFPDVDANGALWKSNVVSDIGPIIQDHAHFSDSCNVGFFEVISRSEINLRVYERGAGETLACGSGACAGMAAAFLRQMVDTQVQVHLRGGTLAISWQGVGHPLYMTGSATRVFEGQLRL